MKCLFFILLLLANLTFAIDSVFEHPLQTASQSTFYKIEAGLARTGTVNGKFTQTQYMALLSSPLVSNGYFSLSKKTGLSWVQETPFSSKLTLTENKLLQQIGDTSPTIITRQEQPIVFTFTRIFLSIFDGNSQLLETWFDIYFIGGTQAWTIGLIPKASPLNKAIAHIVLTGSKYVRSVTVQDTKGNRTVIEFSDITTPHQAT
jgi:outer membrane lipoprotein-sorting protein